MLRLFYRGGWCRVELHCCGAGRYGQEFLCACQIAGHSQSCQSQRWKPFRVAQVSQVEVSKGGPAGPGSDYSPNDKVMSTVYCRL